MLSHLQLQNRDVMPPSLSPFEAAEAGHHRFLQTGSRPVSFKPTVSGPGSVECLCHLALLQFWDVKHVKICESLQ